MKNMKEVLKVHPEMIIFLLRACRIETHDSCSEPLRQKKQEKYLLWNDTSVSRMIVNYFLIKYLRLKN